MLFDKARHNGFPAVLLFALLARGLGSEPSRAAAADANPLPDACDSQASAETRSLFHNLRAQMGKAILFGHMWDTAQGATWNNVPGRSDVKELLGEYPAVQGFDFGNLKDTPETKWDTVAGLVKDAHGRGEVVTFSWHGQNPLTGKTAFDKTPVVGQLLSAETPAGRRFRARLDEIASYIAQLNGPRGEPIPILFRPFHEMNGGWFWWGKDSCSPEEFKRLWRFTIGYLRAKGVHQLLTVYSPNNFASREEFSRWYPGDGWVDVVGHDNYQDAAPGGDLKEFARKNALVARFATAHGKIAALTEVGVSGSPGPGYWTRRILKPLQDDPWASRMAFMLVWSNGKGKDNYGPHAGQASAPDFLKMASDPFVTFGGHPELYHEP